jgi:glutamate N-acetyltransferase/amino-acid N-acetyltransferase
MTTDTHKKEIAVTYNLGGVKATMGAMCKGSGMIHPNMGTMLGFITTDANIDHSMLDKALKELVEDTFNMVSVDGDTSTNDTVVVLANGMAGNERITAEGADYEAFKEALNTVMTYLAKQIAGDGEGATRLFEVTVSGAPDKATAKLLAKSIVTSSLTKCAIYGKDANWGRILCAMGYSGADFDPARVDISVASSEGEIKLVENGKAANFDEELATRILSPEVVTAKADIKSGNESATAWGCDLTYDYVKINADYRS